MNGLKSKLENAGLTGIFFDEKKSFDLSNLNVMNYKKINRTLGNMDLFLMDQLLKGRIKKKFKILDAGCGEGRNLVYFISNGYDVYGIDRDPGAIQMLRFAAKTFNKDFDTERFEVGDLQHLPYENDFFDFIFSISVLHFSDNREQYFRMMDEMIRVVKKGGLLFLRMDAVIGLDEPYQNADGGKCILPDGSLRFLAGHELLKETTRRFGLNWAEPLKVVCELGRQGITVQLMENPAV